jgi:ribosomal protein S27E
LKSIILAQQTILLPRADNLQTAQTHHGPYKWNEEFIIECPDCFDTMVKIYELDKVRYQCENCDLVISEMEAQGFNE